MNSATLDQPETAADPAILFTDTTAPVPTASQIERLRDAVEFARSLGDSKATADENAAAIEELRGRIEIAEDEREVVKLMKALNEAETAAKLTNIRTRRIEANIAAAWETAKNIVRAAIDEAGELVGAACDQSYDQFREIAVICLSPEVKELAEHTPGVSYKINSALDSLAPGALAVGPANQLQNNLRAVISMAAFSAHREYSENALAEIDQTLAAIPNVKAQAAKLAKVHAAAMAMEAE